MLRTRPIPAADLRTTGAIPEPRQRPSFGPSTQTLELALAPANQSSSAGEAIRKLIDSLAAPPEQIGAIQPSVLANNDEDLIPVPAPNQQLALAKWRRVTLDGQAPSHQLALNRGHVGKWGISPRRSLTHIGQLRAPIYGTFGGRNEIAIDGFIKVAATYPTDSLSKR